MRATAAWLLLAGVSIAGCQKSGGAPPREVEDASIDVVAIQCPGRDPRVGAACKVTSKTRCDYEVETCPDGRKFTRTYCCFQGGWEMCGVSEPCPRLDGAPQDDPADAPEDSSVDPAEPGGDGGVEVPADLAPDRALCDGFPPPAYCGLKEDVPCLPCADGKPVACTCFGKWLCEVCASDGGAGG